MPRSKQRHTFRPCPGPSCNARLYSTKALLCTTCWNAVPYVLQAPVSRTWHRLINTRSPSQLLIDEHQAARKAALDYLASIEAANPQEPTP